MGRQGCGSSMQSISAIGAHTRQRNCWSYNAQRVLEFLNPAAAFRSNHLVRDLAHACRHTFHEEICNTLHVFVCPGPKCRNVSNILDKPQLFLRSESRMNFQTVGGWNLPVLAAVNQQHRTLYV